MKRIGELTTAVELLEAKTETFGHFGAAEVAAMSAATSVRHGSGLRHCGGTAPPWGIRPAPRSTP